MKHYLFVLTILFLTTIGGSMHASSDVDTVWKNSAQMIPVGSEYVHYRNSDKKYKIIAIALFEANEEPCVVYKALYGEGVIWVRPLKMFLENVEYQGKLVPRFQQVQ